MKTKAKAKSVKEPTIDLTSSDRTPSEKKLNEVKVSELYLDPENPRLAETAHTKTQASVQKVLESEFNLQPIMDSLYKNGFFWEEPLLAVREYLPEQKKNVLVVIEGNRRLSALKYIHQHKATYPDETARKQLEKVPVIIRDDRKETLSFVGFRHVTGILGWESAAMAQYALNLVQGGHGVDEIAVLIGDKTNKIERLIRTQSLIKRANDLGLHQEDAAKKFFFSYLLTATDAPSTKSWLKVELDKKLGTVKSVDETNLKRLWSWLYGSKEKELAPAISESRQIHKLSRILAVKEAVKELDKTRNLDRAYASTKTREEYVAEVLTDVRSRFQEMYSTVFVDGPLKKTPKNAEHLETAVEEFGKIERSIDSFRPLLKQ